MSKIVNFYDGSGYDNSHRTFDSIFCKDNDWLERTHDYIQWLFPLNERSNAVPNSPILTEDDIKLFNSSLALQNNLYKSLNMMLRFYGLKFKWTGDESEIAEGDNFSERSRNWIRKNDHNHLRLTRILKSLSLLGLKDQAIKLQKFLVNISSSEISPTTKRYWLDAV